MTPELEQYYAARFDMFASKGWKDLVADINQMLAATDTLSGVPDAKALHFKQGEISIMRWVLALEAVSNDAYTQLTEKKDG